MSDILIRRRGAAGRITLARPRALNALTPAMARGIDAALDLWAGDPSVALVVIDAEGERAFCSGGDLGGIFGQLTAGDLDPPRTFWAGEYRLNLKIARYGKPVVSFLQGYTMGGGVGIGCHGSHRIVGETSRIAMPECGIGLIPDAGGTFLLGLAPGRLGEFLGLTGARMGPADAIHAGFADRFVPQAAWPGLIARLEESGDPAELPAAELPPGRLMLSHDMIDTVFAAGSVPAIAERLSGWSGETSEAAAAALARNAPLAMACALELVRAARAAPDMEEALRREYRFVWRAAALGDFREGIRAQIVDKDRRPRWRHASAAAVPPEEVAAMLAPLGADEWRA